MLKLKAKTSINEKENIIKNKNKLDIIYENEEFNTELNNIHILQDEELNLENNFFIITYNYVKNFFHYI